MRRSTWKLQFAFIKHMRDGSQEHGETTFYIEHEVGLRSHRLVIDGEEGSWTPNDKVATCRGYCATTEEIPFLPEVFQISTLGLERVH